MATSATVFKVPMHPGGKYKIKFRNRAFILDNVVARKNAPLVDKSYFSSLNGSYLEKMSYN